MLNFFDVCCKEIDDLLLGFGYYLEIFFVEKNIVLEVMDVSKYIRKIIKVMFVYVKFLFLFFKEIDDLLLDFGYYLEIFY